MENLGKEDRMIKRRIGASRKEIGAVLHSYSNSKADLKVHIYGRQYFQGCDVSNSGLSEHQLGKQQKITLAGGSVHLCFERMVATEKEFKGKRVYR